MKRSMKPGFAGIDNELFLDPRTTMLFGDAKDSVVKLISAVKAVVTGGHPRRDERSRGLARRARGPRPGEGHRPAERPDAPVRRARRRSSVLATSAPDGTCDVSPRGDPPGFVRILDERTLSCPGAAREPARRLAPQHPRQPPCRPALPDPGDRRHAARQRPRHDRRRTRSCSRRARSRARRRSSGSASRSTRCSRTARRRSFARSCGTRTATSTARSFRRAGEIHRSLNPEFDAEQYDAERAERYARREGFY